MRAALSDRDVQEDTRKRKLKLFLRVGLSLVALWILFISANVLFPAQGATQSRSDAVVSLAPQCHRLYTATQLVDAGHTDTLVVSHFDGDVGISDSGEPINQVSVTDYCEAHKSNGVICFTPEEVATIGEVFTVRDIASRESWETLTVVTSRAHAFQTQYIFDHCVGENLEVNLVHTDPELNGMQWVWNLAYENAAFIKALWQTGTRC